MQEENILLKFDFQKVIASTTSKKKNKNTKTITEAQKYGWLFHLYIPWFILDIFKQCSSSISFTSWVQGPIESQTNFCCSFMVLESKWLWEYFLYKTLKWNFMSKTRSYKNTGGRLRDLQRCFLLASAGFRCSSEKHFCEITQITAGCLTSEKKPFCPIWTQETSNSSFCCCWGSVVF